MGLDQEQVEQRKKRLLKALRKTLGVVTPACDVSKVSRACYYRWFNEDPEFRKKALDTKEIALDFAESKLLENVKNNSSTDIIFYLKTQGKKRGYIEKQEVESHVEGSIQITRRVIGKPEKSE